jgi:hypothetical protein
MRLVRLLMVGPALALLAVLTVGVGVGVTGAGASTASQASLVGTWNVNVNWNSGGPGTFVMTLNADHTTSSSTGDTGVWSKPKPGHILIDWDGGVAIYKGKKAAGALSGKMTNNSGNFGTWSATRAGASTPALGSRGAVTGR